MRAVAEQHGEQEEWRSRAIEASWRVSWGVASIVAGGRIGPRCGGPSETQFNIGMPGRIRRDSPAKMKEVHDARDRSSCGRSARGRMPMSSLRRKATIHRPSSDEPGPRRARRLGRGRPPRTDELRGRAADRGTARAPVGLDERRRCSMPSPAWANDLAGGSTRSRRPSSASCAPRRPASGWSTGCTPSSRNTSRTCC